MHLIFVCLICLGSGTGAAREARGGCVAGLVLTGQAPSRVPGEVDYSFSRASALDPVAESPAPQPSPQVCSVQCYRHLDAHVHGDAKPAV